MVKQLLCGDMVVLTANNDATHKLCNDNKSTFILGNHARMVTCIYGIIINRVRATDFYIEKKEKMIYYIKKSNNNIEKLQKIDI